MYELYYHTWWTAISTASGQLALFVLVVAALDFLLRKRSARLRYALWCLVLLKAITPPIYSWNFELPEKPAAIIEKTHVFQEVAKMPEITVPAAIPRIEIDANFQTEWYRKNLATLQEELRQNDYQKYPPYIPTLFAVWLGGLALFFTVRLTRLAAAIMVLRQSRELKSGPIWEMYKNLAAKLKLKKPPPLIFSNGIKVPFLFGLFRPKIVLPATLPEEITVSELENVLLHELTHYRRRDLWVNWFEFPVQGIFWFHPFLQGAVFQLRHLREAACDESVLASGATDAREYGKSLLNTLWAVRGRTAHTLGFLGIFERNTHIQNRLENIMQQQNHVKKVGFFGSALLMLMLGLVPFAFTQDDAAKTAAEKAKRKTELQQQIAELQKQLDELEDNKDNRVIKVFKFKNAKAASVKEALKKYIQDYNGFNQKNFEGITISLEPVTNSLIVDTPQRFIKEFEDLFKEFDAELGKNNEPPTAIWEAYKIEMHDPALVVKQLKEDLSGAEFRCFFQGNTLYVEADKPTHEAITKKWDLKRIPSKTKPFTANTKDQLPRAPIDEPPIMQAYAFGDLANFDAMLMSNYLKELLPEIKIQPYFGDDRNTLFIITDKQTHEKISKIMNLVRTAIPKPPQTAVAASAEKAEKKPQSPFAAIPLSNDLTEEPFPKIIVMQLENASATELSQTLLDLMPELNHLDLSIRLAADANSNSLLLMSAYPEIVQIVEALVMKLDEPKKRKELGRYSIANKSAQEVANGLEPLRKNISFNIRIERNSNSLHIIASPETHEKIAREIEKLDQPAEKKPSPQYGEGNGAGNIYSHNRSAKEIADDLKIFSEKDRFNVTLEPVDSQYGTAPAKTSENPVPVPALPDIQQLEVWNYSIANKSAQEVADDLEPLCKGTPFIIKAAQNSNSLKITALPELHEKIAQEIKKLDQPKKEKEKPTLNISHRVIHRQAKDVAADLKRRLSKDLPSIQVTVDHGSNALQYTVPSQEILDRIRQEIEKLDQPAEEKPQPSEQSKKLDAEIEESLERKAEFAGKMYTMVKAQYDAGHANGTALNEARARFNMFRENEKYFSWKYARMEHSQEQEELEKMLRKVLLEELPKAAEDWVRAAQDGYDAGKATLNDVLAANAELEDLKIRKLKFEQKK